MPEHMPSRLLWALFIAVAVPDVLLITQPLTGWDLQFCLFQPYSGKCCFHLYAKVVYTSWWWQVQSVLAQSRAMRSCTPEGLQSEFACVREVSGRSPHSPYVSMTVFSRSHVCVHKLALNTEVSMSCKNPFISHCLPLVLTFAKNLDVRKNYFLVYLEHCFCKHSAARTERT